MLREATNPTTVLSCEVAGTIKPMYDLFRSVVGKILDLPGDHAKTRLCTHSVMGQIAHYVHARPVMSLLWPELQMSPEQIDMVAVHIADFSLAYLVKRPLRPIRLRRNRDAKLFHSSLSSFWQSWLFFSGDCSLPARQLRTALSP
jgi:hypothetical protein